MLADTGPRVYQWVYAGSMVSVLVFAITKGLTFTKTTLMASSSLHNQVLHKVQPPPLPHPILLHPCPRGRPHIPFLSHWHLLSTLNAPDTVLGSGADTLLTELTVASGKSPPTPNYQPQRPTPGSSGERGSRAQAGLGVNERVVWKDSLRMPPRSRCAQAQRASPAPKSPGYIGPRFIPLLPWRALA